MTTREEYGIPERLKNATITQIKNVLEDERNITKDTKETKKKITVEEMLHDVIYDAEDIIE